MDLPTEAAKLTISRATALPQRSTSDVIADLKRQLHSSEIPSAKRYKDSDPIPVEPEPATLLPFDDTASDSHKNINPLRDEDEDQDPYGDWDDDAEDEGVTSRPKKVTERKRRLNAIADSYVQTSVLYPTKDSHEVTAEEEGSQSAKWLVNQSENREIISTPREYQVELFERAKEKNIIAVLDTGLTESRSLPLQMLTFIGSGKTLIAVLLLRHVLAQELEDRVIGKQKRVAFFLVSHAFLNAEKRG